MTVRELGTQLRTGQKSSVQLVTEAITKAKEQEYLRAFITITQTEALAEAAERDQELKSGRDRGPLHGIPIALKDLFYTKGVRTTGGSRIFENFVPDFDAVVVSNLRAAGAVSIGKTNLHELAFGITSRNPHFGPVLNPLDRSVLAGGSSGGSAAAIASGIIPVALGTDTGGSIRIPASFCGVVGLKPTYGLVSRKGVLPLAFSLDHVGPLGSNVEDCALALNAMVDGKGGFNLPALPDLRRLRVGLPRNFFFEQIDEPVSTCVSAAIASMQSAGAEIIDVQVPDMAEVNLASRIVQLAEFASLHINQKDENPFGVDVWPLLEQGRTIAGHEYVNAQRLRTIFRSEMDALWQKVEVLVTPTTPIVAPEVGRDNTFINGVKENVRMASTRLVRGINYLGEPALSMPCGVTLSGLPVGLQLIGAPFTEPKLLQIAKTLEGMLERQSGSFDRPPATV